MRIDDPQMEHASDDWSFTSSRVFGRLLTSGDEAFYIRLFGDPKVMAHIAVPMSSTQAAADFARVCRHNANPQMRARYWYLSHRETSATIGLLSLIRDAKDSTRAELGLMLQPEWQGRGVGLQALHAVVDAIKADRWSLGIEWLLGRHAASNPSAGRLVEALGFECTVEGDEIVWRLCCDTSNRGEQLSA